MTDTIVQSGQAAPDSTGTTGNAPVQNAGTSVSNGQTTGNGPDAGASESFFDPTSIADKPELLAAYKQMQSSYTKRMQDAAKHRPKIEAYDRFEKDPMGTMQQLAAQYGFQLVQRGQEQPKDWNPQSWDDVMTEAEKRVLKKMEPVYNELREVKKQNIETYLDSHYADWRTYEGDMMETLQAHPSLVRDPDKLYRLSVPEQVWEARATQKAMQKLKGASEHAQVSGGSTTTKQTTQEPSGPVSFDQAVEIARKRVAAQGLRRPAG